MSAVRIVQGDLFADILHDSRGQADVWMYVVQRPGSVEILAMGSCPSQSEAEETARYAMNQLRGKTAVNGF